MIGGGSWPGGAARFPKVLEVPLRGLTVVEALTVADCSDRRRGKFVDLDVGRELEGLVKEEQAAVSSLEDDNGAIVAFSNGVTGTRDHRGCHQHADHDGEYRCRDQADTPRHGRRHDPPRHLVTVRLGSGRVDVAGRRLVDACDTIAGTILTGVGFSDIDHDDGDVVAPAGLTGSAYELVSSVLRRWC